MKKVILTSLTWICIFVLFLAAKRYYYSYGSGAGPSRESIFDMYNVSRNSLLTELPIDSMDVLFVGNSITEGFPVTEIYGPGYKNRGIGGNTTSHILNRITPIAKNHPKKIFLECGVNDLNAGVRVDSVFKNYRRIIEDIRENSLSTTIYVQSVFPTCKDYSKINNAIVSLNANLYDYCKASGIDFINIHPALVRNGQLDSNYTEDGIHLNGKGYAIWKEAIEKYVQ